MSITRVSCNFVRKGKGIDGRSSIFDKSFLKKERGWKDKMTYRTKFVFDSWNDMISPCSQFLSLVVEERRVFLR